MTRYANICYSLAFILVMVALALASLPGALSFSTTKDASLLDGRLTSTFEKHYDKGFVLKDFGTNAWAALEFSLFGEGRPGVVIGRDEWLYTAEEFNPPASLQQINDNWRLMQGVKRELERRDIELVVLMLPAKARLYPEHLGEQKPVRLQQELYADARQRMQRLGLQGPDLLSALEAGKREGQVFLRTDTHWTPYGSSVVADAVAKYLQARDWPTGETRYTTEVVGNETHKGDLLTYLPLDPYFVALQPKQEPLEKRVTEQGEEGGDLFGASAPELALVGTSYSANPKWNFLGALRQSLSTDLYNYAEDGHGPLVPMLRLLAKGEEETRDIKLVLWEVPERYLAMPSDLAEFDPQWLAQLQGTPEQTERLALKGAAKPLAAH